MTPPSSTAANHGLGREALPHHLSAALARPVLPALDAIRAFAANAVIVFHYGVAFIPGPLAVLMFYVLSGFLITWLLLKEFESRGTVSLRNFYIRRSLRIFPAFYVYWFLTTAARVILHKPIDWVQAVCAFFYVTNYYQAIRGDFSRSPLSHSWSLSVEEQFYLLWPFTFLFLWRTRWGIVRWVVVIIAIFIAYRSVLYSVLRVSTIYIYESFDARADHLLVGCLTAIVLRKGLLARFWTAVCSHPAIPVLTLACLASSILLHMTLGNDYRFLVAYVVDPLLMSVLIVQLISFSGHPMWAWLNNRWLCYLGRISYSTYLYQQVMLEPMRSKLGSLPLLVQLPIVMASVAAVASLSYFLVELPFLKLRERFSKSSA